MAIYFAGASSRSQIISGTLTAYGSYNLMTIHNIPQYAYGIRIISLFLVGGGGGSGQQGSNSAQWGQGAPGSAGWNGFTYNLASQLFLPGLHLTELTINVGGPGQCNHNNNTFNADLYSYGDLAPTYGPGRAHGGFTWNGGGVGGNSGGRTGISLNSQLLYYAEGGGGGFGGKGAIPDNNNYGDHGGMTKDSSGVDTHYIGGTGYSPYGIGGVYTGSGTSGTGGYATYQIEYFS